MTDQAVNQQIDGVRMQEFVRIMQTVYSILMVLGFKEAFQVSYQRMFPATPQGDSTFALGFVLLALAAIAFLGLRFFWVPRTIMNLLWSNPDQNRDGLFRQIMMLHLPITLFHGTLFYYLCRAYEDMATATSGTAGGATAVTLVGRVVFVFAGLLLVNAVWLWGIAGGGRPSSTWAWNNTLHVVAIFGLWLGIVRSGAPAWLFLAVACGLFLVNSMVDLWKTAKCYIFLDHRPTTPASDAPAAALAPGLTQ